MDLEKLKSVFSMEGAKIQSVETTKNGVSGRGITIIEPGKNVGPIVYYNAQDTLETFVDRVKDAMQQPLPDVNVKQWFTPEYLQNNVRLCVQKKSKENVVKRNYLDVEVIVKLFINSIAEDEIGTIKLTHSLLDYVGVIEEEVFEWATFNTWHKLIVESLNDLLGIIPEVDEASLFFIVGTTDKIDGGAALCFPQFFYEFCLKMHIESCLIIPSSTQEVLIIQDNDFMDVTSLAELVKYVNDSCVVDILQMNASIYRYNKENNVISIAATIDA